MERSIKVTAVSMGHMITDQLTGNAWRTKKVTIQIKKKERKNNNKNKEKILGKIL